MRKKKIELYKVEDTEEEVQIRFGKNYNHEKVFTCKYRGKFLENGDLNKLEQEIEKIAKSDEGMEWQPVILMEGNYQGLPHFEKRLMANSNIPEKGNTKILAHVSDWDIDDKLDASKWKAIFPRNYVEGDEIIIPYTRDTWETLIFLKDRMKELGDKINGILMSKQAEKFIDSIKNQRGKFLPLPIQLEEKAREK